MKKIIVPIILSLLLCSFTFAQTQFGLDKIKEINLLESNRDDVRRILASYNLEADEDSHYDRFSLNNSEIRINYSEGNCEEFDFDAFNVPEWKAIHIDIEPDNPIKLKDLKIDFSRYKKEKKFRDIDDLYAYYDKESGIVFTIRKDEIAEIEFIPPSKYYNLMCDREKAKKLSATSSIFENKLKNRSGFSVCISASVNKLNLSRTKIIAGCDASNSMTGKTCSEDAKTIDISTMATDPENDVLTYDYTVTGGKIIGTGAKVVWDLSNVNPGIYTITAAVDDGCGFCGETKTKSIVVKKCSKCR